MAIGYLIKNGFLIETIEVRGSNFGLGTDQRVRVATLDSVLTILDDDELFGDNTVGDPDKLTALRNIWGTTRSGLNSTTASDVCQLGAIGSIISRSNVKGTAIPDIDEPGTTKTIHDTSNVNILPPRFGDAWAPLSVEDTETSRKIERARTVMTALEGSFTDIKSFKTEDYTGSNTEKVQKAKDAAYAAYNEWKSRGQGDNATKEARAGYLRNG